MARLIFAIALATLTVLSVLSLDARLAGARTDDGADCTKGSGDTKIGGCSGIIKSGRLFGKPISKGNLASVYYNRGVAYGDKGDYDRAIADYTQAIKLDPKHAYAYYNRGVAYKNLGQTNRAIQEYRRALELDPDLQLAKDALKRLGAL